MVTETVSSISFSDSSDSSSSHKPESNDKSGSTGGKFTTANFTETVITHSGSVFGSTEKSSKKSKKSASANGNPRTQPSSAPAAVTESVNNCVDEEPVSISEGGSESKTLKAAEEHISNVLPTSPQILGATPSGNFASSYENFLSGSYPGITTADEQTSKRQRSQSSERSEKKRPKKGTGTPSKKTKKKRDSMPIANGLGQQYSNFCSSGGIDHTYFRSYSQSASLSLPNGIVSPGIGNAGSSSPPEVSGSTPGSGNMTAQHNHSGSNRLENPSPSRPASGSPLIGPPRPGAMNDSSSRNAAGNNSLNHLPQSLEQLLERQWEQGSQFLMEQAQHFDIASLLSCLHQLRMENQRLEEHVNNLISRREHLLAVNARLSVPLSHPNAVPGATPPNAAVAEGARTPRINNYLPLENGVHSPQEFQHRSPSQAASPAQASTPSVSGLVTSATPPHGQPMMGVMQNMTAQPLSMMSNLPNQATSLLQNMAGANMMHGQQSPSLVTNPGHNQTSTASLMPSGRSSAQSYIPTSSPIGQPCMGALSAARSSEQLRMQSQLHQHQSFPMFPSVSSSYPSTTSMHTSTMSTPVSVVMSLASQQNPQQSSQQQVIQHSAKKSSPGAIGTIPEKR